MTKDIQGLLQQIRRVSGSDRDLDRGIAHCLDGSNGDPTETPPFTASVDACIHLIERTLPGWHWHVGYGPKGIMPYAALMNGELRYEATAPTVPLALLIALLETKMGLSATTTD